MMKVMCFHIIIGHNNMYTMPVYRFKFEFNVI